MPENPTDKERNDPTRPERSTSAHRRRRGARDRAHQDRRIEPAEWMDAGATDHPLDTRGGPGKDIGDEIDLWP